MQHYSNFKIKVCPLDKKILIGVAGSQKQVERKIYNCIDFSN